MRLFEAKYTDTQRDAVIRAMLDEGWSAPDTVRAAAAGDIPGVPEPFEIPLGTVYWLAREERQRREEAERQARFAREPLPVLLEQLTQNLLQLLLTESRRCLAQAERGDLDLPRVTRLIPALRTMRRLVAALPKRVRAEAPHDELDELRQELKRVAPAVGQ